MHPEATANNAAKPPSAKTSRWKRLLQNLALSFVTFFLCVAVLEIVLRFAGYGGEVIYQPDPKLYWRLEPNQNCVTKIGHKPVHINSHGTRGPEFTTQKPPNTIRILSLGDSRTFGWGLSWPETYSDRLQELLQQKFGSSKKIQVIDAGVNAWSYPQMLVYFREYGLAYHPDVVVVADANLWTQFSEHDSPEFVRQFMWRVRLKNFLRRFAIYDYFIEVKLIKFYERERVKFIPVNPSNDPLFKAEQQKDPYAMFRSAIANLCRLAQTNGVKPVLLFLPTVTDLNSTNLSPILKIKRQIHDQLHVPLVDMTPELRPQGKALYLDADPVHLNAVGNKLVAEKLFETLTNVISP